MNNKCIYYVEGPCEQQLIAALKEAPERLIPGKIKVFNVVQNLIPKSQMLSIQAGTTVVLVFDTDVPQTSNLKKNLELLNRYCGKLKIIFLPQVLNLEDELVRCTDVADGLFCREIDGLFCRSSPDIIVRRRCVLSHKRRGWLQPSPSFRYSRNLALQDELYHPVINNGPAVLVCVDKRLGTGPVNQSRDAG